MRLILLIGLFLSASWSVTAVAVAEGVTPFSELATQPTRSAAARALSLNDTTLSAEVSAAVNTVHVRVSQRVKKGELLVSLNCKAFNLSEQIAVARLDAAQARLSLAQSLRARAEKLLSKSLTSQEVADTRIAEALSQAAVVAELDAAAKRAQLDVGHCKVTAPFDGVVTSRLVATGELAQVGTALLTLVDTENMELTATVAYSEAKLLVGVDAFSFDFGERLPVSLHNLGGVIDSQNRSQEVRFVFPEGKPLPGTAGKLLWSDPRSFLPAQFIVKRAGTWGYFKAVDAKAKFVALDLAVPGRPVALDIPLDTLIVTERLGLIQHDQAL